MTETETEDAYTAALHDLAALLKKLDRAQRRVANIRWEVDAQLTRIGELRQSREAPAELTS